MSRGNSLSSPYYFTYGHSIQIEGLIAGVTSVGSPTRAECDILGMILDVFWLIHSGHFWSRTGGGHFVIWKSPLSPNNFTWGHVLKIEWLVASLTAVRSLARVEHDILGMILDVFWPVQAAVVVGEPLCDLEIPS